MKWVSETDKKAVRVARLVVLKARRITGIVGFVVIGFFAPVLVKNLVTSQSDLKASNASLVEKLGEAQTETEWLYEVLITPEFTSLGSNAQGYEEFREERSGSGAWARTRHISRVTTCRSRASPGMTARSSSRRPGCRCRRKRSGSTPAGRGRRRLTTPAIRRPTWRKSVGST